MSNSDGSDDELSTHTFGRNTMAFLPNTKNKNKFAVSLPRTKDPKRLEELARQKEKLYAKVTEFRERHEAAEDKRDEITREVSRLRTLKSDVTALYRVNRNMWCAADWDVVQEYSNECNLHGPNIDRRIETLLREQRSLSNEENSLFSSLTKYEDRHKRAEQAESDYVKTTTESVDVVEGYSKYGNARDKELIYRDLENELRKYEGLCWLTVVKYIEELREHYDADRTPRGAAARDAVKGIMNTLNELKRQGILSPMHVVTHVTTLLPQKYLKDQILSVLQMSLAVDSKKKLLKSAIQGNGYIRRDRGGQSQSRGGRGGRHNGGGHRGRGSYRGSYRGRGNGGGGNNKRTSGIKCHRCGGYGHLRRNCPSKGNNDGNNSNQNNQGGGGPPAKQAKTEAAGTVE